MRVPVAWRNLCHRKRKTLVAVLGVTFAIILIFVQLAFHGASLTSAVLLLDLFDYDIAIIASNHAYIREPGRFSRTRVYQAAAVKSVQAAIPVRLGVFRWRVPHSGIRYSMLVVGVDPMTDPFATLKPPEMAERLRKSDTFLFDEMSKPFMGRPDPGEIVEVGDRRLEHAGTFSHGSGFATDGLLLVNDDTFMKVKPTELSADSVQLGLLRLSRGADVRETIRLLQARMPDDVRVLSRRDFELLQEDYYVASKPIGVMFQSGVFVGWLVGAAILYQVLANDVASRLRQYASLKAIGFSNAAIVTMICQQAITLTVLSFAPAVVAAYFLYGVIGERTHVAVDLTLERTALVGVMTFAMTLFSAVLASRALFKADPAELFA